MRTLHTVIQEANAHTRRRVTEMMTVEVEQAEEHDRNTDRIHENRLKSTKLLIKTVWIETVLFGTSIMGHVAVRSMICPV
jgi:hypothetical protein